MKTGSSTAIIETASRETLPLPMTALLLCGGQSRRMGSPKSFLPYEGSNFVEHRLASLRQLFQEVLLVANNPGDYDALEVGVVKDIIPQRGPLVGILSGLLVSRFDYAFVIACDMPLVDNRLIRQLCAARKNGADVVILKHESGIEPLLGVYSRKLVPSLEEYIFSGKAKAQDFLSGLNCTLYEHELVQSKLPPYFNVNTPQDYALLLE